MTQVFSSFELLRTAVAIVLGLVIVYIGLFLFGLVAQRLGWDRE